jgi:cobalt-zinc-cadmium efflux system outer membrane protein
VPPLPDIEQRADVRAAVLRVQAAQAAFDNALALRRNDVTVGSSLDHYPGTSRRLLELRLSMPLAGVLGGYNYEGEIGRARAALDQAQDQLDKTRRVAQTESGRLGEDVRAAASRASEFAQAIVPRARQVAAMAELAYSKGALPLVDLIDARRTLRTVLLDDIAARADYARAQAAWQLRQASATP